MTQWSQAIERFLDLHPHRHYKLFTEFLPQGYEMMTLSSVKQPFWSEVWAAKCFLGMHITLYDDLADNPALLNQNLLDELYSIAFGREISSLSQWSDHELKLIDFARFIVSEMYTSLAKLPRYHQYRELLEFDIRQFYNTNRYYTLAQLYPHLCNSEEARHFGPFNMGMIIAGTIDIMASPDFCEEDLGRARALFLFAQRFGHICNSLTTLEREIAEHTFSNEALLLTKEKTPHAHVPTLLKNINIGLDILRQERQIVLDRLYVHGKFMTSFDAIQYANKLNELQRLHERLQGII